MRIEPTSHHKECVSPFRRGLIDIPQEVGGMWEYPEWEVSFDNVIREEKENQAPCPHCIDRHIHLYTRYDKLTYEHIVWICPRVVVVYNEGGYNSTGTCLDCILDAARRLDK